MYAQSFLQFYTLTIKTQLSLQHKIHHYETTAIVSLMIGMIKYQCNGWRNESAKAKFVKNNYVVLLTCTCKINDVKIHTTSF